MMKKLYYTPDKNLIGFAEPRRTEKEKARPIHKCSNPYIRQKVIRDLVNRDHRLTLDDIARRHQVSVNTIYKIRDTMTPMEQRRALQTDKRIHPGLLPCMRPESYRFCFGVGCRDELRRRCPSYHENQNKRTVDDGDAKVEIGQEQS